MPITAEQTLESEEARALTATTRRPTVAALEDILQQAIPVLDHGFLRVIDYMGDDDAIVQAARVSYGRGTKRVSEDRGLIRYLMRHWHSTPFEMCEIKLHVKLPIFVARQWIRHRTANVNEYSARYSILDREFYVPDRAQIAQQSSANRQGRGAEIEEDAAKEVVRILRDDADRNYASYQWLLNEPELESHDPARAGVSRELARIGLSLSTYTQWYWKVDLHNLLGFLRLRADPHAQWEIRTYAEHMLDLLRLWVPVTYEAFMDYRLGATSISSRELTLIRQALDGERPNFVTSGLSRREWDEFASKFGFADPSGPTG